jgi:hypothetical protein
MDEPERIINEKRGRNAKERDKFFLYPSLFSVWVINSAAHQLIYKRHLAPAKKGLEKGQGAALCRFHLMD